MQCRLWKIYQLIALGHKFVGLAHYGHHHVDLYGNTYVGLRRYMMVYDPPKIEAAQKRGKFTNKEWSLESQKLTIH